MRTGRTISFLRSLLASSLKFRSPARSPSSHSRALRVPRLRDGRVRPEWFARCQRHEQACVLALLEQVIHGVSTRNVPPIPEARGGTERSTAAGSARCQPLDPIVTA